MLDVYTEDVHSRLPQLKAAITSTYGRVDSTRKISRKLVGAAVGTATWPANVDNEKEKCCCQWSLIRRPWYG